MLSSRTKPGRWPLMLALPVLFHVGSQMGAPTVHAQTSTQRAAIVQISRLSVQPQEVQLTDNRQKRIAVVTIGLWHQIIHADEQVTVELDTFLTEPPDAGNVAYKPGQRVVHLSPHDAGYIEVTADVVEPDLTPNRPVKVVIAASLRFPSAGLRLPEWRDNLVRTTLTIK